MNFFNNWKRIVFLCGLHSLLSLTTLGKGVGHGAKEENLHIHGSHVECLLPKSKEDIINCALKLHPSIRRESLKVDSALKISELASQVPNPTISARYVKGDRKSGGVSELETNLNFTLELGGKRNSRKEYAKARENEAYSSIDAARVGIKISTIRNLTRLRQVLEEKEYLGETKSAFLRVIKNLKALPRLSAGQEGSLTFFEIGFEEMKLKQSKVFEDEKRLEHYFHLTTGHSLKEIKGYLPKPLRKWPKIEAKTSGRGSSNIRKLTSFAELAQRKMEIEKANAWPDIKVGPSFSIDRGRVFENKMIGFNIQLPLPLFQLNGGGKAYARSELSRAQKNIALARAEENHERSEQVKVYKNAVRVLEQTMKKEIMNKNHLRIEKHYLRGVVSSSTFLEFHKQRLSYIKSRNERELTALSALWSIYSFDGVVLEKSL